MQGQLLLKLGALSDSQLVEGLYRIVGSGRRLLAELLAHLCEVEARRLHLDAGYPSLFAYCMARLGFTEDEAYRRISVARLARKAPVVFTWIAEGRLSLSVAALLQPHVLAPNLEQLIEAVAGKSVKHAREVLAAFSPRSDVVSSIRRLPQPTAEAALGVSAPAQALLLQTPPPEGRLDVPADAAAVTVRSPGPRARPSRIASAASPPGRPSSVTQPLSPGRFKIQFTADAALKDKLELARDLLRHAMPTGDLAGIVDRALDLLVTELEKRRFGAHGERKPGKQRKRHGSPENGSPSTTASAKSEEPSEITVNDDTSLTDVHAATTHRAIQREVCERDGFQCTWRGPDGMRCSSRAWLEQDHRTPRALGGTTSVQNLRLLCKAHNRRAAELVFGQRHIEKAITLKRNRHPANDEPSETTGLVPRKRKKDAVLGRGRRVRASPGASLCTRRV